MEVFEENIVHSSPALMLHNKLLTDLYIQKENKSFCDVEFVCGDAVVCVHACVLASFSLYIRSLLAARQQPFDKAFSVDEPMQIQLNISADMTTNEAVTCHACTSKVVNFFYVGKIYMERDHLGHVRCIARILRIDVLSTICDRYDNDYNYTTKSRRKCQSELKRKLKLNAYPENLSALKKSKIFCHKDVASNKCVIVLSEAALDVSLGTSNGFAVSSESVPEGNDLLQFNYQPDTQPLNSNETSSFCSVILPDATSTSFTNEVVTSTHEQHMVPNPHTSLESKEFSETYSDLLSCGFYKNLSPENGSRGKGADFMNQQNEGNSIAKEMECVDLLVQTMARNESCKAKSLITSQDKAEHEKFKDTKQNLSSNLSLTGIIMKCTLCGEEFECSKEFKVNCYQMNNLECASCVLKNKRPNGPKQFCNDKDTRKRYLVETEPDHMAFDSNRTSKLNLFTKQLRSSLDFEDAEKGTQVEKNSNTNGLDSQNYIDKGVANKSILNGLPRTSEVIVERQISDSKRYFCNTCQFSTNQVKKLLCHLEYSNHGEVECSVCNFLADGNGALKEHLLRHNDRRPFFCDICRGRYLTLSSFKSHLAKHSLEGPGYHCATCKKGFKRKQALQTHLLIHFDEKKHLCDQCGFKTNRLSSLKNHKLEHSGRELMCPQLGCTFKTSVTKKMEAHKMLHVREKNIKCDVCGELFAMQKYLNRHKNTMHSLLSLSCPFCTYQTKRSDKLKEHCKNKHTRGENVKSKPLTTDVGQACESNRYSSRNSQLIDTLNSAKNLANECDINTVMPQNTLMGGLSTADKILQLGKDSVQDGVNSCSSNNLVESSEETRDVYSSRNGLCKLCNQSLPLNCGVDRCSMMHLNNFSSLDRNQAIVLNESTGELSIVSISNDEQTMSTVTLNETTGLLTLNINRDSTSAVFLNESTGEMSYVNLNKENNGELSISNTMNGSSSTLILNESTGALLYSEQIDQHHLLDKANGELHFEPESNVELPLQWDDFEIGDWTRFDNEDSLDGFFFDKSNSLFPLDDYDGDCDLTAFLNEYTGELVVPEGCQSFSEKIGENARSESTVTLDESTGQLMFSSSLTSCPRMLVLNEYTGELSARKQSNETSWINNQGCSSSDPFAISGERAEQLFDALSEKSMDSFNH